MKPLVKVCLIILCFTSLQGCFDDDDDDIVVPTPPPQPPEVNTITDIALGASEFSILVEALQATGLDQTLDDPDATFTVFAPTNAAFEALGQDMIDQLLNDTDTLTAILTYHVVGSEVDAAAATAAVGTKVETVNGAQFTVMQSGSELLINGITITNPDFAIADNGIIHVIDEVLMPPNAPGMPTDNIVDVAVAGGFSTLADLLVSTGLDTTLANMDEVFTVFAPTNEAFAALGDDVLTSLGENPDVLEAILLQHVVVGDSVDSITAYTLDGSSAETASGAFIPINFNNNTGKLTFGGASIDTFDVYASNGVIHVIDSVVVGDVEVPKAGENIAEIASQNQNFSTLVAALQATGLDSVLANEDAEFTVFAPSDAAFAKLGQETIDALLNDTDTLSNILLYHVLAGSTVLQDAALMTAQSDNNIITMANDQELALSVSNGTLYANSSVVSATDVVANNGVIHVIDQVILPPDVPMETAQTIVDVAIANPDFSTLVQLLTDANLVDTLSDENATFTVFAPTNAAFDKIPDTAVALVTSDADLLEGVLLQHVVSGAQISSVQAYAANGTSINTAANNDVTIEIVNFTQFNNANTTEVAYDTMNQRLVGGAGSTRPGFSVYVFDNDLGSDSSDCNGGCADNWPPVLVEDGEVGSLPGLSMIERGDGSMQAAYLGRPLYFFAGDAEAGDINGNGVGGVWWLVNQPEISLQINGSNVTTADIYTSNGVIHVIDTVILETVGGM